jgi:hypothetical protein
MTFLSSDDLDEIIDVKEAVLNALKELRHRRSEVQHRVADIVFVKNSTKKIKQIQCSCGEITKYKVPLTSLEDFDCPKEGK